MRLKRAIALIAALALCFVCLPIASAAKDDGKIKNVIFMIGDGMGENHLKLAKQNGLSLFMENNCDLRGQSKTKSTLPVTDSAAGATALSSGVRVTNGTLGVYAEDPLALFSYPRSVTETAILHGMKTGIVTTDSTAGATPAGFSVHVLSRKMAGPISDQQVTSDIDLIWGAACEELNTDAAKQNGFNVITTKDEMEALDGSVRSFGQFSGDMWKTEIPEGDASPTLSEMTVKAIDLLNDDPDGFYLMVEGAHIDKHSHNKDNGVHHPEKVENMVEALNEFDNAIEAAVNFAREDGHTLVVVTADHETGAITYIDGEYKYTSGSHSGANVPLFVFGSDSLIEDGAAVDNKSIPVRVAAELGWAADALPMRCPGVMTEILYKLQELLDMLQGILPLKV